MILTDTHTHLYASQFDEDRKEMIDRCLENGIERLFLPNIDATSIEGMMQLANQYPDHCFPMMGLHPTSVKANYKEELELARQWLDKEEFCAIGEIGIDLYWDDTFKKEQEEAFRIQIEWAKEMRLPIVIHSRDSFDEIFSILDEVNDERLTGIFHCFTGNADQARHIINYDGFKLGIGGVVTFKNGGLDKVLPEIDMNHLVLETDSPYLAPTPYRGKRNESAYLINVANRVAEIYNTSIEEVAEVTTQNSKQIFGI